MRILVFLTLLFLYTPAFADYSAVIEDLPLMPGMIEKADEAVLFDKTAGRIVELDATRSGTSQDVAAFYVRALPELGWQPAGVMVFTREGETLKVNIVQKGSVSHVHFSISPANEGK